jgi:hypothetical protein
MIVLTWRTRRARLAKPSESYVVCASTKLSAIPQHHTALDDKVREIGDQWYGTSGVALDS